MEFEIEQRDDGVLVSTVADDETFAILTKDPSPEGIEAVKRRLAVWVGEKARRRLAFGVGEKASDE